MGDSFGWVELTTDDLEAAKDFYGQVFDWKMESFGEAPMPYYIVKAHGKRRGGMMAKTSSRTPVAWTPYVEVDDLSATCDRVERLGGRILKHKTAIPGMGWFAVVHDPQGAVLGLWQSRKG
ncbi:MAG: VOC family protein [Desulfarculaceae bacterium]|nr:VOC family protein [Desulfarculaceae bacterium]